jgi:Reverse transcriptase (RNA-dependent DNA polymerase)
MKHPHKDGFLKAAYKEFNKPNGKGTFKPVSRPANTEEILAKYKARIMVRGDLQHSGLHDTYATTLALRTFRALMAIIAAFNLDAEQWDAVNAFINSYLDETVYVEYLEGFGKEGKVLLLLRALYGLRRSPRLW